MIISLVNLVTVVASWLRPGYNNDEPCTSLQKTSGSGRRLLEELASLSATYSVTRDEGSS